MYRYSPIGLIVLILVIILILYVVGAI